MGFKNSRKEDTDQFNRDYHDHNLTDLDTLKRTLFAAIEAMEEEEIPYALIGGVAVKELGRPRVTHDIDLFVSPDDADRVLKVLAKQNFITGVRDPHWLYKAWREEVLVDIIFKSSGDIYFDEEVRDHVRRVPFEDKFLNAISPEDFIVIKAAVHQEHIPHHWHDALAVLTQGNLDWNYLVHRAKHAPRRVLSLLIYAQSNDVAVPSEVIQRLYRMLYEPQVYIPHSIVHPYRSEAAKNETLSNHVEKESPIYIKGRIMEALTIDERIAEHDIRVIINDTAVIAKGEVYTSEQREAIEEVISSMAPSYELKNLVDVRILNPPEGSEVIR